MTSAINNNSRSASRKSLIENSNEKTTKKTKIGDLISENSFWSVCSNLSEAETNLLQHAYTEKEFKKIKFKGLRKAIQHVCTPFIKLNPAFKIPTPGEKYSESEIKDLLISDKEITHSNTKNQNYQFLRSFIKKSGACGHETLSGVAVLNSKGEIKDISINDKSSHTNTESNNNIPTTVTSNKENNNSLIFTINTCFEEFAYKQENFYRYPTEISIEFTENNPLSSLQKLWVIHQVFQVQQKCQTLYLNYKDDIEKGTYSLDLYFLQFIKK